MKEEDLQRYYNFVDHKKRYTIQNSERLEEIKNFYEKYKKYFGKTILDIGCGGGLLGYIVNNDVKYYLGIDLNPEMVEEANKLKKEANLNNCEFIQGNITKLNIDKKFDTITCIGNTFAHITTLDFVEILKSIEKLIENKARFILEYRDFIYIYHNNMIKKLEIRTREDRIIFDKLKDYNDQVRKNRKNSNKYISRW